MAKLHGLTPLAIDESLAGTLQSAANGTLVDEDGDDAATIVPPVSRAEPRPETQQPAVLVTPRTRYNRRARALEGDALKIVNQVNMSSFRRQFQAQRGKVDIITFITMMQRALHNSSSTTTVSPSRTAAKGVLAATRLTKERAVAPTPQQQQQQQSWQLEVDGAEMTARLVELFREIDLDGDGLIVWDEFTRFIVDKAMRFTGLGVGVNESLKEYVHNLNIDPVARYRHKELLDKLVAIPRRGLLAAIEQRSPVITLYNHKTGAVVNSLTSPAPPVALTYVEPLHVLVTANSDTGLVVWNMDEGPLRSRWQIRASWPAPSTQMSLAWVPSKQLLYSGATTGLIYAWDVDGQDREHRACLRGHSDIVLDLLSLDALDLVGSASLDTSVCLWDAYLGTQRQRLLGHKKGVFSLAYSTCHRLLFSAGFDHEAFVWSPFTSTAVYKLKGHTASMVGVVAVEDRPQVVTADATGTLKLWDLRNFRCVQTFTTEHTTGDVNDLHGMTCLAHTTLDYNQPRLVVATKRINFFDQLRVRTEPFTDDLPVSCALYNPECLTIITAAGRNIKVWDALLGNVKHAFLEVTSSDISAMCLDHRKRKIIVGDVQGAVQVYNHRTGALMKSFAKRELPTRGSGSSLDHSLHSTVSSRAASTASSSSSKRRPSHRAGPAPAVVDVVYLEGRRQVLVGYSDAAILLYDETAMQSCPCLLEFDPLQRNQGDLACLALSRAPGSTQAASASGRPGDAIKLWNHETAKCEGALAVQVPCTYSIVKLLFLDPLPLLAVCCSDGAIRVWATWGIRLGKRLCLLELQASQQPAFFVPVSGPSTELYPLWRDPAVAPPPSSSVASPKGLTSPTSGSSKKKDDNNNKPKKRTPRAGQQQSRGQAPPPVMSLAWDDEEQQLFSGDETGLVRQWDLRPFVAELAAHRLLVHQPMVERWATGTLSDMDAAHAQDLLASFTARAASLAPLVLTLEAHDDAVLVLDVTREPHALLSASSDQCARMWSLPQASLIGTLIQGLPVDIKSPAWDMPLDVASRQAREEAEISAVLESLCDKQQQHAMTRKRSSMGGGAAMATMATRSKQRGASSQPHAVASPSPMMMAQTTSYVPRLLPACTATSSLFATQQSVSLASSSSLLEQPSSRSGGPHGGGLAEQRHQTILHVLDTVRAYVPSSTQSQGAASTTMHHSGGGGAAVPGGQEAQAVQDREKLMARTLKRGASIIPSLGAQPKLGAYSQQDDEDGGLREDRPPPPRGMMPVLTSTIKRVAPVDLPPSPGREEADARQADVDMKIQRLKGKLREIDRGAGEDIGPLRLLPGVQQDASSLLGATGNKGGGGGGGGAAALVGTGAGELTSGGSHSTGGGVSFA